MSCNIFLVDDEPIIRKGIMTSIPWQEHGFAVCGEASNGQEALDLIPELHPDLVITDIRMPIMDGLELSTQIRRQYPAIKVLILSGYDDFEYAQKAIRIGVDNYLLKPVGAQELLAEVTLIREKLEAERAVRRQHQMASHMIRENFHNLKATFVQDLVRGNRLDWNGLRRQSEVLDLPMPEGRWTAVIFSIDDYQLMQDDDRDIDRDTLRYLVLNVVEEVLREAFPVIAADGQVDQLIALVCYDDPQQARLKASAEMIQAHVRTLLGLSLTVGVGLAVPDILQSSESYAQAVCAVRQKAYLGRGQIIAYQAEQDCSVETCFYPTEQEKILVGHLRALDEPAFLSALQDFLDSLNAMHPTVPLYRQHVTRLLYIILSSVEELGIDCTPVLQELGDPASRLNQVEVLEDFETSLQSYLNGFSKLIQSHRSERFSNFVSQAIAYIQDHFAEDLTLATVAEVVHITPNYLSRVFKAEMGTNFVDWLNRYRVEQASLLMKRQPGLKTYEVAEMTGFQDYKYFTYVFKKYTGTTPKEFRG
jgi:two-component system response regulator YesN